MVEWSASLRASPELMEALQRGLQVQLIATPRADLRTCSIDEELADVLAKNSGEKFDYLPVIEVSPGGVTRIVGLVDMTKYLDGATPVGSVRGGVQYLSEDNVIGANASIIDFFRRADTFACRLLMSRSQISGLVHLSDIQKLPVRAALFALITELEIAMLECIEVWSVQNTWEPLLSTNQLRSVELRRKKAVAGRIELGKLAHTLFSEKVRILSQSKLCKAALLP
jgi:hypothetical protein